MTAETGRWNKAPLKGPWWSHITAETQLRQWNRGLFSQECSRSLIIDSLCTVDLFWWTWRWVTSLKLQCAWFVRPVCDTLRDVCFHVDVCVCVCVTLCFLRSASPAVQVTLRPRPAMPLALLYPMSFLLLQAAANPITVQTTRPRVSHRSATSFSSVCTRDCHISCFITQFCVFLTCAWWIQCKSMKRCWFDFKLCTVGWFKFTPSVSSDCCSVLWMLTARYIRTNHCIDFNVA